MKSYELKERLEKAQAKVDKCKATIERHKKQAEKKLQILKKAEWLDTTNPSEHKWKEEERARYTAETGRDLYWDFCDYEDKLDDIKTANKKLEDAKRIVKNWEEKLERQMEIERKITEEMPEIFSQLRDDLAREWQATDIEERERMKQKRQELSYEDFRKIYTYSKEESLRKSDEEFLKIEERDAEMFIVDLYNRVYAITGEVTDWRNIHYGGKALNGFVVGKAGKASVETILAGGYNIQRLHMRVLVHEVK